MACVVLTLPYDLPSYLPSLLTSLLRHVTVPAFKDTVTKTVQLFRLTHQDRWDEFQLLFSREQLEDLQVYTINAFIAMMEPHYRGFDL